MIEPAAYGAAVIFGPHVWNFREAAARLVEAQAAIQIADADALVEGIRRLLADPAERAQLGLRAQELVKSQQGATERTISCLDSLLQANRRCAMNEPPDEPWAFLNGQFVPLSQAKLPLYDAGLVQGATVTDFVRTFRQELYLLDEHLQRFRTSCQLTEIALFPPIENLGRIGAELIVRNRHLLPANQEMALILIATPGPIAFYAGGMRTARWSDAGTAHRSAESEAIRCRTGKPGLISSRPMFAVALGHPRSANQTSQPTALAARPSRSRRALSRSHGSLARHRGDSSLKQPLPIS